MDSQPCKKHEPPAEEGQEEPPAEEGQEEPPAQEDQKEPPGAEAPLQAGKRAAAYSELKNPRDQRARSEMLKEALGAASGTGAATEMAKAIFRALEIDQTAELVEALARMTNPADASHAALADAVLEEASQHPGQTAHSAVARAAVKANMPQNILRKRYNNRVSPKFRRAATLCL